MSRIRIGDTVAFRRDIVRRCNAKGITEYRGKVTDIADGWLFMAEACGRIKVMPATNMCKVAHNGVILELV